MFNYLLPDGGVPILVSATSAEGVAAEAAGLLDYLRLNPEVSPATLGALLMQTRSPRHWRALINTQTREETIDSLKALTTGEHNDERNFVATQGSRHLKIAFVFPGQGSQWPGMGKRFSAVSEVYRDTIAECDTVFAELYGIKPSDYLLNEDHPELISIIQPAMLCHSLALVAMWRAAGVEPTYTVGHSQGEIAAACAAGCISLTHAAHVVASRSKLVENLVEIGKIPSDHTMAVLGLDRDSVESLMAKDSSQLELSVVNSPNVHVISGEAEPITNLVERLTEQGIFARRLRVDYPAHSSSVANCREEFKSGLSNLESEEFKETDVQCFGAATGEAINPSFPVVDYWFWNFRNTVRFDLAILNAAAAGADTFIEISDHPTLLIATQDILADRMQQEPKPIIAGTMRRDSHDLSGFSRTVSELAVLNTDFNWDALRTGEATDVSPKTDFPVSVWPGEYHWAKRDTPTQIQRSAPDSALPVPLAAPLVAAETWERIKKRKLVKPQLIGLLGSTSEDTRFHDSVSRAAADFGTTTVAPEEADTIIVTLPAEKTPLPDTLGRLSQYLENLNIGKKVHDLWLLTQGGEAVEGEDSVAELHAAAMPLFRSFASNYPGLRFRHLDLDATKELTDQMKAAVVAIHVKDEPELCLRSGSLYRKRFKPVQLGAITVPEEVFIAGGTGYVGMAFAERVAELGAKRIVLISRSGLDAKKEALTNRISKDNNVTVLSVICDVTNPDDIAKLGDQFPAVAGTSRLLVHCTVDYNLIDAKTADKAAWSDGINAKSASLTALSDVLLQAGDTVVASSSIAAILGTRDCGAYAAVNRLLEVSALDLQRRGIKVNSVKWGLWHGVGAGDGELLGSIENIGLSKMHPQAAVDLGLAEGSATRLVISIDWQRTNRLLSLLGMAELFEELETADEPSMEVEANQSGTDNRSARDKRSAEGQSPDQDSPGSMVERIDAMVRSIMGLPKTHVVDDQAPLVSLGLDSLQALDLQKIIDTEFQQEIAATRILAGLTLEDLRNEINESARV